MAPVSEAASYLELVQGGSIASLGAVYAAPWDGCRSARGRVSETDSDDDDDDYDCAPAA
jgi:RNase P/RNase MRP subunit p30